jgi:hypothetical protein
VIFFKSNGFPPAFSHPPGSGQAPAGRVTEDLTTISNVGRDGMGTRSHPTTSTVGSAEAIARSYFAFDLGVDVMSPPHAAARDLAIAHRDHRTANRSRSFLDHCRQRLTGHQVASTRMSTTAVSGILMKMNVLVDVSAMIGGAPAPRSVTMGAPVRYRSARNASKKFAGFRSRSVAHANRAPASKGLATTCPRFPPALAGTTMTIS